MSAADLRAGDAAGAVTAPAAVPVAVAVAVAEDAGTLLELVPAAGVAFALDVAGAVAVALAVVELDPTMLD